MGEFLKVVNFQPALENVQKYFKSHEVEIVSLEGLYNRILAEKIISPESLPAFNRSTVDGYAVRAEDTFGSSETMPGFLNYIGQVEMGGEPGFNLGPGECCWIPTGGMLPDGANAAVMVEYTEKLGEDTVIIHRPVSPWENVMQKGEDFDSGQILFQPGQLLRAQDIGILASLGINKVSVLKPFKVGIISTGDEVVPIDKKPSIGQIRDVNSYAIAAAVQSCGSIPRLYPIVKDQFEALKEVVDLAWQENDLVLMSGGSSVGIMDVTLDVLLDFPHANLLFHGLAVKPGKPTMAVVIQDKLVIGLPGHPVSALMMFHIICAPILRAAPARSINGRLTVNLASQAGRDDFVPVQLKVVEGEQVVEPILGKSGLMSILTRADGFIHIPYAKQGLVNGERVRVYLF